MHNKQYRSRFAMHADDTKLGEGGLIMARTARRNSIYRSMLAGSALALAASTAARAQVAATPATSATGQVAEVVVTAQYREQRLQDTPIAITAVSGDMI